MSGRRSQGSLVFDIEVSSDFGSLGTVGRGLSESGSMEESDCLRSIVLERTTELSETSSKLEEHVKNVVLSLWPTECIGESGVPEVEILREKLSSIGYQVQIVGTDQHKARPGLSAWQQLPHTFLLCHGVLGPGDVTFCYQQVPCVIDPRFKEQFEIAHPSSWFETLLKVLPDTFVGKPESLRRLVLLISEEMVKAFLEQKLSVPPWRNPKAMSSKWGGPISDYMKCQLLLSGFGGLQPAAIDTCDY